MTLSGSRGLTTAAVAAGAVIGVVYTLSPLAVWCGLATAALVVWTGRGLPDGERQWIRSILIIAIAARVAAIAWLFVTTDHHTVPFGSFFGDEEYFIKRSIWLRNVALGIPIHRADLIYAFDDYSYTSYLYVLAFVQVLVGPSPYGVHLFCAVLYLTAVVILYKVARPAFGRAPASLGLVLLLFLPSLFAWSISALKEPLFFLLSAIGVAAAVRLGHVRAWTSRAIMIVTIVILASALQTVREVGFAMTAVGLFGGLLFAYLLKRPKALAAFTGAVIVAGVLAWQQPIVQYRSVKAVQQLAQQHWGHLSTQGYVYELLEPQFYRERSEIPKMSAGDMLRFIVRAGVSYVVVPLPWNIRSRSALAYLPEQTVWYVLVLLIVPGIIEAKRRDTLLTCLLLASGGVAVALVALTGGNVGTLVRHRGLAIPYLIWLSATGACAVITWLATPRTSARPSPVRLETA
jgi:hypothetical protein